MAQLHIRLTQGRLAALARQIKVSPDIMEELSSPRRHLSHPFSAASKTLRANAAPATNAASQPAQTGSAPSTAASASPAKRNQGRAGSGKRKGGVSARRGSLPYQVIAAHLDHELSLPPCARGHDSIDDQAEAHSPIGRVEYDGSALEEGEHEESHVEGEEPSGIEGVVVGRRAISSGAINGD